MIRGLYTAASGMIARQAQMDNLTNNLANTNTPGYKLQNMNFKSFDEAVIFNMDNKVGSTAFKKVLGSIEMGVAIDQTNTDFTQGIQEDSERNLDFSLNGKGFFTVLSPNGAEKYTRSGRFLVSTDGRLVTPSGCSVLGIDENGNKTPIILSDQSIKLDADGSFVSGNNKYRFAISQFSNTNSLDREADNMYVNKGNENPILSQDTEVKQYSLEASNVNTIESLTDMISIMRNYESNQKVIDYIDDTLDKSVNQVGKV
jgi:flagellar basal-body rod protein FlgG